MATGTEGNDSLTNDPSIEDETVQALGGDDAITIGRLNNVASAIATTIVNGGAGFDTLSVGAHSNENLYRSLSVSDLDGTLSIQYSPTSLWNINWTSIERIEVTGVAVSQSTFSSEASQDIFRLTGREVHSSTVQLSTGAGQDEVYLFGWFQTIDVHSGDNDDTVDLSNVTSISSNPGVHVTVLGGAGNDNLRGSQFADKLTGGTGDDILDGGGGADVMSGMSGDDQYRVDDIGDIVNEIAGEGSDTIRSSISYAIAAGNSIEFLSPSNVFATTSINFAGNEFAQTLIGNAGNNILNGAGGGDLLAGFAGNDLYYVNLSSDVVLEGAGEGSDSIFSRVNYALGAGQEIETLSPVDHAATTAINLTGNELNQTLWGNAGNNILFDGGGSDLLIGLGGNDTYYVDSATSLVMENAGQGSDTIFSRVSYALGGGQEIETLSTVEHAATTAINLAGNQLNQTLYGNAGNNILFDGGGTDLLIGLGGNDTYYVDSVTSLVVENAGGGSDAIFAHISYALGSGQEIETLSTLNHAATTAINLTGNQLSQTLWGNAGDNVLYDGGGTDLLIGFGGNDTYYMDSATSLVMENAGGGSDAIFARVSYALAAGQEIETLSTVDHGATTAISLAGNQLNQTLYGNAGNNVLYDGGGTDLLIGFGGNDTYYADSATSLVMENADGGSDAIFARVSYALAAGQEIETLSTVDHGAATAINLTGNELSQTLWGNAGNNVLDGKGGNDILAGLGGADHYSFTTVLGSNNIDTIVGFETGTDKIVLDRAVFSALAAGQLSPGAFQVGGATDADDRIIYDATQGTLFYDVDGSGPTAAILFALVAPNTPVASADFIIA